MNNIQKDFDKKFPGKRLKIQRFLFQELKRLKKVGWPNYCLSNYAQTYTKNILNILVEKVEKGEDLKLE